MKGNQSPRNHAFGVVVIPLYSECWQSLGTEVYRLFTLLVSRCASHWWFSEWGERWWRQRKCFLCRCPYGKKPLCLCSSLVFSTGILFNSISQNISKLNQSFLYQVWPHSYFFMWPAALKISDTEELRKGEKEQLLFCLLCLCEIYMQQITWRIVFTSPIN